MKAQVVEALTAAAQRVEASGDAETVDLMRIIAGCGIAEGFDLVRDAADDVTRRHAVIAVLELHPGKDGCARVRLEKPPPLRGVETAALRAENERLRAENEALRAELARHAQPQPDPALDTTGAPGVGS